MAAKLGKPSLAPGAGSRSMTPLDRILKRSITIKGVGYVVTLSPDALKITRKGRRLGLELKWVDITSGESALAVALHASVGRFDSGVENAGAIPGSAKVTPPPRWSAAGATPAKKRARVAARRSNANSTSS